MHNQNEARPLAEVIGANAAARRRQLGLTQEGVAERMRRMGLRWSRPAVATLEAGKRALGVGEFYLLAEALDIWPDGLLEAEDNDEIKIDGCVMPGELLGRLHGEAGRGKGLLLQIEQAHSILDAEHARELAHNYGLHDHEQALRALHSVGEAERRAAVRITRLLELTSPADQITGFEVSCAAVSIWGHGLASERDRLTGNAKVRPSAQLKGHFSRRLEDTITERIATVRRMPRP